MPGARFCVAHHDDELGEDRTIRGVVVSVDELADAALVRVDGVPIDTWAPLEILCPEHAERTAA